MPHIKGRSQTACDSKHTGSTAKRNCKTKQCGINEILHNHQDRVEVNESDGDEACSATNCQINLGTNVGISWTCCEECNRWYHLVCVGLEDKSEININNMDYICAECSYDGYLCCLL